MPLFCGILAGVDPISAADAFHVDVAAVDARSRVLLDDPVVQAAEKLAVRAHGGQVDKTGDRSIDHIYRVARAVSRLSEATVDMVAAAWLHDIVEDTHITLTDIEEAYNVDIAALVDSLTRKPNETYLNYIHRAAANPAARAIKIADNRDNMARNANLANIDPATAKSLLKRYMTARTILLTE